MQADIKNKAMKEAPASKAEIYSFPFVTEDGLVYVEAATAEEAEAILKKKSTNK